MKISLEQRSSNTTAKSLKAAERATERVWRKYGLTYDDICLVGWRVRQRLGLRRPRKRQRTVERLSGDEARRLIDHAYRASGRDGLLVKTLLLTGARVSEFVAIRLEDVYWEERTIRIRHGKGDKERTVPLLPGHAQELRTFIGGRRAGHLFETADR